MAFRDFPDEQQGVRFLQRSLERRRLAHGYLFTGNHLAQLEALARALAKTLNCQKPVLSKGVAVDCCDECIACRKVEHGNHPDVHWVRPESKIRIVTVDQIRELMKEIQLKPTEAEYKVAVIVAADRLKTEAANAFLKTLEEPPPKSVLILLTGDPHRVLETILSRCLRLNFGGEDLKHVPPDQLEWLRTFSDVAAKAQKSLLSRYRLMDILVQKLTAMKGEIEQALSARSPLQQYQDAEKEQIERWEAELSAAVEAEYRRQRSDLLTLLHCWLRDIWVVALSRTAPGPSNPRHAPPPETHDLLNFSKLHATAAVAERISNEDATRNLQVMEQLQRWLGTNVQEALALEVGLLKLRL